MKEMTEDEFYALSDEELSALYNTGVQEAEDELRKALKTLYEVESLFYPIYRDYPCFRKMQMLRAEIENALK